PTITGFFGLPPASSLSPSCCSSGGERRDRSGWSQDGSSVVPEQQRDSHPTESVSTAKAIAANEKRRPKAANQSLELAGPTGLEPATSGVTGRRSSRLNYD